MGYFALNTAATSKKSTLGGGLKGWKPITPPPTPPSASPTSTPPRSPLPWRRYSSSPSSGESQAPWAQSRNWRTGAPLQPSKVTSLPKYDDNLPGNVVFLPVQLPPSGSIIYEKLGGDENENPWGHPAVITGMFLDDDGKECVYIRLCTSFGSQRVEDHRKPEHWKFFVLADNMEDIRPHPHTRLATLEPGSGKFPKRTYVNIGRNAEYSIEFAHLEKWGQTPVKFDAESTQLIAKNRPY
ncbi:uncharacterized protein K460DRAFT_275235 [Cucurbitaria berberidis CBS 394.84]|uniref:Uncharacterized protein n=1 Tax=Cucurbitaria berberidis CBS 394.84 TaxID=1168544 RepID=A0A9P4GRW9_9PLEO|nr:uncharacterized protein K460DRAFT_275235 [Cucurbitaria berberidis CBS 394.84]KAF1849941.1 hypothetical protein K460DRAFT_275235 [Cucurbitaria berberidis CBS 394.84]